MAWTAPRTWVTGEVVTAALMNTHVRDNLLAIGNPILGSNTTEATTTSTSAVDLLTVTSLSIDVATPIVFVCSFRRTTGASAGAGAGLKLNATVVTEASAILAALYFARTANETSSGAVHAYIGPRVANHLRAGARSFGAQNSGNTWEPWRYDTADAPTATITDVIMRAIVENASITMGADELFVYGLST